MCAQLRKIPLQTYSCSTVFFEHFANLPQSLPPLAKALRYQAIAIDIVANGTIDAVVPPGASSRLS